MPQRPDGAAARQQQVTFTKSAAERIAAAVRGYEAGDRGAEPLRFNVAATDSSRKVFRIATFTGSWAIGETKSVTFKYQTSTPNTAAAVNLFFPFPEPSGTTDCAIAKDGTAWHLIDVPFETATVVFVSGTASQTVVSDITTAVSAITYLSAVSVAATLNTTNCSISVSSTQTTASVSIVSTVTKSTATIAVVTSTYTASFLQFKVS